MFRRRVFACRSQRRSLLNCSIDAITASVNNSASLICGVNPPGGRDGACSGWQVNKSSIVTYSATARASRPVSTWASRLVLGFQHRHWTPLPSNHTRNTSHTRESFI